MELLEIIRSQSKLLFNNRVSIFATIALPIILTFLFSSAGSGGGEKKLYVCDLDKSTLSQELKNMITEEGNIKIVDSSEESIKKALEDQKIGIALVIEKGYSKNLSNIKLMQNYESSDNIILSQLIERKSDELKSIVEGSKVASDEIAKSGAIPNLNKDLYNNILKKRENAISLGIDDNAYVKAAGSKEIDATSRALVGFLVLFLWFIVVQGSRTIIEEKENGTYNRILSTQISYNKFLICKCISIFIYGAVHIIVILIVGKFLFKLGILENALTVSTILAIYLFALISLTMTIIPYMKTQQQFSTLSGIIIMVTGMLGGTFFPLEVAPNFIKTLSNFTPQGWAMVGLTDSIIHNSSIGVEFIPIITLFAVGVLGLIISALLTKGGEYNG